MTDLPNELSYTESHEWVRLEDDSTVTVGITDHAQHELGELVFVELPEIDTVVSGGEEVAVVESVKTAADIYAPVTGRVIAINDALSANPELVNQDAYRNGWLFKMEIEHEDQLRDLLDAERYLNSIEGD